LPKVLQIETTRKSALLTVAMVSALALAQWFLASESVPAAPVPGSIVVAQGPPKCGQDAQHPCPKGPQQPVTKGPPQPGPGAGAPGAGQKVIGQPVQGTGQPNTGQPGVGQKVIGQPVQGTGQPNTGQPGAGQKVIGQPGVGQKVIGQPVQGTGQQNTGQPGVGQKVIGQPVQGTGQPGAGQKVIGHPVQGTGQPNTGQPGVGQKVVGQPVTGQPVQTFKRITPVGQQPGQTAGGPAFGNVQDLRAQRHERTEAGGRIVIEEPDHRQIVREGGQAFVRHDESQRFFQFEQGRRERRNDGMYSIFARPGGDEIITVTDDDGRLVRRFRRDHEGREFILIDNRRPRGEAILLNLPVPVIGIPQDQYIVDTAVAPEPFIYQTLAAPPLVPIERAYSLDEIRYNVALRDRMRRIDVDTITFDFGSWEVAPDQVARLQLVAQAIQEVIARNPNEVFLVEGHTDAVGQDVDNLSLSDRRAETVASILTESFQIPPENLTSQGYGSHFLKIQTPEANRQNRRVTLRRITPLLAGGNG
jgi:outer membrane protein OmpA-like peptidoglycan-associated protein